MAAKDLLPNYVEFLGLVYHEARNVRLLFRQNAVPRRTFEPLAHHLPSGGLLRAAESWRTTCGPSRSARFGGLCRKSIHSSGPTTFTRAGVAAAYPHDTMILPLGGKAWPPGLIDMLGLPW
jgi:hypothetical protein